MDGSSLQIEAHPLQLTIACLSLEGAKSLQMATATFISNKAGPKFSYIYIFIARRPLKDGGYSIGS